MKNLNMIPATTIASSFGMSSCAHASLAGGFGMRGIAPVPATRVSGVRGGIALIPTQGQVADFAGKRDYATASGSPTWSPSTC